MLGIARLADRGPTSAAALAALMLVGAVWLPLALPTASVLSMLLTVLSAAVVAFVTLRRGEGAAARAGGICVAMLVLMALPLEGVLAQVPLVVLVFWLPAVLAAVVLRRSVSLDLAVLALTLCGALVAIGVRAFTDERGGLWREVFAAQLENRSDIGLTEEQIGALIDNLSSFMADSMGVSVLSVALCSLFLARYWQASMVHPGGFRAEFHALSLGRSAALICLVSIVLAVSLDNRLWNALASVAVFAFFVQGLAVAHAIVRQRGLARGWLVGLYALLLLPHTLLLLAALGLADNVFRLRAPATPSS